MKVLIFNPSFMGDSILTTPLAKAVKSLTGAEVSLCVRPENAPLFQNCDLFDEVVIFDKRKKNSGISGLIRFIKELRSKKYDIIISPHKSVRSTVCVKFAGAKTTAGFHQAVLSGMYTHTVHRDMSLHEVQRNLMLLKPVLPDLDLKDFVKAGGRPEVYIDEAAKAEAGEIYGQGKTIGFVPGSVWPTKRWPAERFAHVAEHYSDKGYTCVIIGGPDDMDAARTMIMSTNAPLINLTGKTPLSKLGAYVSELELMVTNDTGPLHVAVSAGVPTVSIFGPTVEELGFFPYDDESLIAEVSLYCRPCGLHGAVSCPEGHFRCMYEITEDMVIKLCEKQLGE